MSKLSAESREEINGLVSAVHSIGQLLAKNATAANETRRLPEESVDALTEIGAFRIFTQRHFGGIEGGAQMLAEVARTLGQYCPASAWVTVISNGSVLLANRYPTKAVERVFGDNRDTRVASIFAPSGSAVPIDGGYKVNGTWGFSSGILHADWAIGFTPICDTDGNEIDMGMALMSVSDLTIKDTWHTVGMRGTGSHTMIADDVEVPASHVIQVADGLSTSREESAESSALLRLPPISTMTTAIATPVIGTAQAALKYVAEKAPKRSITYTNYATQASSGAFVHNIGATSMKIDSALLHIQRSAAAIDDAAQSTTPLTLEQRRRVRGDVGHAMYQVCDAMNDLLWLHGTAAFAESSPLQQMWRDVSTGARHAGISAPMSYELYGGSLVGNDPIVAMV